MRRSREPRPPAKPVMEDKSARLFGMTNARQLDHPGPSKNLLGADGKVEAMHESIPYEGFIHVLDREGRCPCSPHMLMIQRPDDRFIPVYSHNLMGPMGGDDDPDDDGFIFMPSGPPGSGHEAGS